MNSLSQAKRFARLMKAPPRLSVAEFEALVQPCAPHWEGLQARQSAEGTPGPRQPGGGRKGALATAEWKLFFILFSYKAHPTQDLMGLLFGLTQGQLSDWVRRLTAAVGRLRPLHKPARPVRELRDGLARDPALQEVIIEGSERRRHRPTHAGRQRRSASGRQNEPTVKNVSVTGRGDIGFAGLDPGAATLIMPGKKPKGRRHGKSRAGNRLLARARVKVEHPLASVKRGRILRDEFRNRRQGRVDALMEIGCTFHIYRGTGRQGTAAGIDEF